MFDRKVVKSIGKENFKKNYWRSVLCALILMLSSGATGFPTGTSTDQEGNAPLLEPASSDSGAIAALIIAAAVLFLIKIFVLNPLQIGCCGFFKENVTSRPDLGVIKESFTGYGRVFITLLLRDIFLTLWTMLLIVPGIIKAYSYRMVPFIIRDNPEFSATEAITRSRKMMDGHKWDVFVFDLSYIGWILLGIVTCGLALIFWTEPYIQNANAVIYCKLKEGFDKQIVETLQ